MKLETVTNLLKRIGFDSIDTVTALADESLEAATVQLASYLRVPTFTQAQYDDRFQIQSVFRYTMGTRVDLNLSMGLVDPSTFQLYRAGSTALMEDSDPVLIDPKYYKLNETTGRVTIHDQEIASKTLKATYTAGLENDDADADLYDDVPGWLKSAALTTSIIRIDQIQPTLRHDDQNAARLSIEQMTRELQQTVAAHIRYFPDGYYPVNG